MGWKEYKPSLVGDVYQAIKDYYKKHHYSPAKGELAAIVGVSEPTLTKALKILKDSGFITYKRYKYRSYEINHP